MDTLGIIFTVVIIVILVLVGLYFLGRKLQKKQVASQEMIEQNRQQVSPALPIDKKKMKITDSTLPKAAVNQVPFYLKMRKMPMVKVKIGPQIATLLCDGKVFKSLPVKKMVKIEIAGAYILGYSTAKKGDRKPEPPAKLTFREKLAAKIASLQPSAKGDKKNKDSKK